MVSQMLSKDEVLAIDRDFTQCSHDVDDAPQLLETNWLAITGAPSSGKTTCVDLLATRGYLVNRDASRDVLEAEKRLGHDPYESRGDEWAFQARVFCDMWRTARRLDPAAVVVHDYALPDNIAFYELAGFVPPKAVIKSATAFRYRWVFVFQPLKFESDGIRTETAEQQADIFERLIGIYQQLNYAYHVVPGDLSPQQRVSSILRVLDTEL